MGANRPGDLVAGRFRLAELLAESDRGRFWRAEDDVLGRPVSIDVVDSDDERAPRLLDAARAAAAMGDPRLMRILDAAIGDDIAYVVNEWGEGTSLDDQLAVQGPLEPRHAAWVVSEVADTVARAHSLGLVHGRLIPENVLLDRLGAVRVIGFAVEPVLHDLPSCAPGDEVRSLGALLHATLTGTWPGDQASVVPATTTEHGHPMRPRQIRAGVPRVLDDLCAQLLALPDHAEDRPALDAAAVRTVLLEFVEGGDATGEQLALTGTRSHRRAASQADVSTEFSLPALDDTGPIVASPAPPPPPIVPKPLFADAPLPAPVQHRRAEPPALPPDAVVEVPGRRWMRLGLAVGGALVVIVAAALAYGVSHDHHQQDASPPATTQPPAKATLIEGTTAHSFDPQGHPPTENPDETKYAVDGDPTTGWHTMTYIQQFGPHGLKTGVGLVVDLHRSYDVTRVSVTFGGMPTRASITISRGFPTASTHLATSGAPGGTPHVAGSTLTAQYRNGGTAGRYVTIWLTAVPHVKGGYRGTVDEVHVVGTPVT